MVQTCLFRASSHGCESAPPRNILQFTSQALQHKNSKSNPNPCGPGPAYFGSTAMCALSTIDIVYSTSVLLQSGTILLSYRKLLPAYNYAIRWVDFWKTIFLIIFEMTGFKNVCMPEVKENIYFTSF